MRWSELITIYLAIGAPFAVARFLRPVAGENGWRKAKFTTASALGWPVAVVRRLTFALNTRRKVRATPQRFDEHATRAELLQRRFLVALQQFRETAKTANGATATELTIVSIRLRENVERYIGLALLIERQRSGDAPADHEVELFQVAGRRAADGRLGAKCLQRRNRARCIRHWNQARADLLKLIAGLTDSEESRLTLSTAEHLPTQRSRAVVSAAREIFRLFDDQAALNLMDELLTAEPSSAKVPEVPQCNTSQRSERMLTQV